MSNKSFAAVFGAGLAIVLLLLYSITVIYMMTVVVRCEIGVDVKTAQDCVAKQITQGMEYVVTSVAALVSALVVSQLAVTEPGANPSDRLIAGATARAKDIGNIVTAGYLIIWGLTGLAALVFGVMIYPDIHKTLADLGTTWLGLAVAAGYAYFSIKPNPGG